MPDLPFIVGEPGQGGPDDASGPTVQVGTVQKNALKKIGRAADVATGVHMKAGRKVYTRPRHPTYQVPPAPLRRASRSSSQTLNSMREKARSSNSASPKVWL